MRNQTFKNLKNILSFLIVVFFITSLTNASAGALKPTSSSQTSEIKSVGQYKCSEPNQFVLNGVGQRHENVHIIYSTTSITGKPILNYEDSKGTYSFIGDEISTQKTVLGTKVTVTLESVPDLHVITLTLLVPEIKLNGSEREFNTIAIKTTTKTTIAGDRFVKGASQSHEVIKLKGTASCIMS